MQIGGEAAERDDTVNKLAASAAVLPVLMAATLVLSFNSFRLAAVIDAVAFLSVGLSLGSLFVFGFMAIVGTMGLVGVAISGGVVGSTLLALIFVPSAYRLVACPRCVPGGELEMATA